jgi:hypothetical protein
MDRVITTSVDHENLALWQGKRQEARGKSEEVLGDFTFFYTDWFDCVHLLSINT